jgi:hypothetical protein
MKISLKKSFNRWVKVGENGEQFYIDYPTIDQEQHLQSILFGDEFTGNDKANKYFQYYLKYCIKDWKNINDENGGAIKCVIKNNELDDELWWALVKDFNFSYELYAICSKELEFTENDKKKFSSQASSDVTTNSQGGEKTIQ